MALSGELFLPMIGLTVQSFTTDTDWDRTRLLIDDADWDSANIAFTLEIVGHNTDSVDRDVSIVDTGGTVFATVTIPANTAAADRVRLRSSSFSLDSGATTYLIRVKLTGSNGQVNITMGGIHCVLSNASKAVPRFLLAGVTVIGSSQNSFIDRNNSASLLDLDVNKGARFLLAKANYGGTVAAWGMGATVRKSSAGDIDIAAVNFTDTSQVATLGQKPGSSTPVYEEFTWTESATNFDDGDEFWIQMERSTGGGFTEISRAELFVKLTSLEKTESHFPMPHGDLGVISDRHFTENRSLFTDGSYDSIDDVIWEASAGIGSGDSFNMRLRDAGANDSGVSGSNLSSLFFDSATVTRKRNTGLSLTNADRHYAFADETVTASMNLGLGRLILVVSGLPVVEQNIPLEQLALADSPERPVALEVELMDALESLALADVPAAPASFDFEALPSPVESLAFSDTPLAPAVTGIKLLTATESLSLADSASLLQGPDFSPLSLTIAEMKLDQGTKYQAGKGVRHPDRYYKGKVGSFGRVVRSIPVPVGVPQVGDAELELIDTDFEFRKAFAEVPPQNREMVLKVGPEESSERLFHIVFTGEVSGVSFPPGVARVSLRDKSWEFLDQESQPLLTRRNFAPSASEPHFARNLRQRTEGSFLDGEVFSPIVHGRVRSTDDSIGAMNAVRIDAIRWNLTRTAIPHAAIKIFRKLTGDDDFTSFSGFSIVEETKTIDGITYIFTHIDISPEEPESTEIRWEGDGITLDGTKEGALSRNGADNIRLYLQFVVGKTTSDFNDASFTETADLMNALEIGGISPGLLFDGATVAKSTHGQVLTRMLQSCGCALYLDKRGLITISYISQAPVSPPELNDVQDIYLESETHTLPDPIYTAVDLSYARSYATQDWGAEDPVSNPSALAAFGREERFPLRLWFVRDIFTAVRLGSDLLTWTDTESMRITFTVPGHRRTPFVELAQNIAITSYSGVDQTGGGYSKRPFLVVRTSFDLDTKDLQITAISRIQPEEGQGFVDGVVTFNARFGPHYQASGNFFGVFRDGSDINALQVQGSTDWGQSWEAQDPANAPTYAVEILAHDSTPDRADSKKLLIVTQTLDGVVDHHLFDMSLRKWEFTKRNVWPSVSGFANIREYQHMAQIDRSRTTARLAVFFFRQSDPNASGQFGGIRGRTAWAHSDDDGLTWSSPADIGQDISGASPFGELYDYQGGRVVAGKDGRFHFFYQREPGDFTRSTEDAFHRTAKANGSLTSEVKWILSGLPFFPAPFNVGLIGDEIDEDGELQLYVPFKGTLEGNWIKVESKDSMSDQLNWNAMTDGNVLLQGASESFPNYPMAAIQRDSLTGALHFMGVIHRGLLSNRMWAFHSTGAGAVGGADRIGPFYDSVLALNNAGFLVIDLVGELWIATFQEAKTTLKRFYFTLWPLSKLPRPESFDTVALEQAVADQED